MSNAVIDYLKQIYKEGRRYNTIIALSGTLAKLNVPEKVVHSIYKELCQLDDEDRSHIIRNTYKRYADKKPIQTLHLLKDIEEYRKLYELVIQTYGNNNLLKYFTDEYTENTTETEEYPDIIDLSEISLPILKQHKAYEYLTKQRKLADEDISKYNIRLGKGIYSGYVILPVFDEDGNCIYFTGRAYLDNVKPKYKNSPTPKSRAIWFSDYPYSSDTIIICEGIFNAISSYKYTGILSCAILGKTISKIQLIKLQRYDNIILNFDGDVDMEYVEEKIVPMFEGKNVSIIEMPIGKDVNDMDKKEYLKLFLKRKQLGYV